MDRFHARYSLASVLTAASGCDANSSTLAPFETEQAPTVSPITTRHDAKIRNVFDRKRFFAVVSVGPTVLKPDEATDVDAALVIADTRSAWSRLTWGGRERGPADLGSGCSRREDRGEVRSGRGFPDRRGQASACRIPGLRLKVRRSRRPSAWIARNRTRQLKSTQCDLVIPTLDLFGAFWNRHRPGLPSR